eukprot:scaffold1436_cov112-Cylindrotheca_fusiformis.AAC.4
MVFSFVPLTVLSINSSSQRFWGRSTCHGQDILDAGHTIATLRMLADDRKNDSWVIVEHPMHSGRPGSNQYCNTKSPASIS